MLALTIVVIYFSFDKSLHKEDHSSKELHTYTKHPSVAENGRASKSYTKFSRIYRKAKGPGKTILTDPFIPQPQVTHHKGKHHIN